MFARFAAQVEGLIKGLLFDCRRCGQCVLRSTRLTCPQRCPKGLRNGPCGGTLDGRCEYDQRRPCIWVRIDTRRHGERLTAPPILPAIDPGLRESASMINLLNGRDREARVPLPPFNRPDDAPHATASRLAAALRAGRFVLCTEIRAPRRPSMAAVRRLAPVLAPHFDAINATAYLAGHPALPSGRVAAELASLGIEAVAQATCRDHTRTSFLGELLDLHWSGVHNLLCLTGDGQHGGPATQPVFAMDASLMLHEARSLREHRRLPGSGRELSDVPRPFLGAAINPLSDPIAVPIRRLLQKADAGAEFVQSQVVADVDRFAAFMAGVRSTGVHRRLAILAGIPVIVSERALSALDGVPGLRLPPELLRRLHAAADIRREGVRLATELGRAIGAIDGVRGLHLMLFGSDHHALLEVRQNLALPPNKETPCRSPASPSSANASIPVSPVPSA